MSKTKKSAVVKTAKKATKKTEKKPVKKTVKKAKVVRDSEKPTLESILEEADRAFTDLSRNYLILGEAFVKAITFYGNEGKKAFRMRYPLTDNALRNLELVGRGRLLPAFAMCSDMFVSGLVNMNDSIKWQHKILGASECGKLRVRVNGRLTDIPFSEFRSGKAAKAVLTLVSKADENLTTDQLREKLANLDKEVRANFSRKPVRLYEIRIANGNKVVRFMKPHTYTAEELREILAILEA